MIVDFNQTQEYLDTQKYIDEKKEKILPIDDKIASAYQQLNSFGFKILTMLGLGPDDFRSDTIDLDTVLPGLANTNLSYKDLERKIQLLSAQKLQLLEEINGLIAVLRQLELNARLALDQKRKDLRQLEKNKFISLYENNPLGFMGAATSVSMLDPVSNRQKLYYAADQLLAVISKIDLNIDKVQLKKAWQVVSLARDISLRDSVDKSSSLYADGAEQFFTALVKGLPEDLRGITILYKAGQYEKVDKYLDKILFTDSNITDSLRQALQLDIDKQRQIISKRELDSMAPRRKPSIFRSKQRSS